MKTKKQYLKIDTSSLSEHQYLLTPDLKIVNAYDRNKEEGFYFGKFLFCIDTTEEAGESLRKMLQSAVDSAMKTINE
jgi:hypothetical protein